MEHFQKINNNLFHYISFIISDPRMNDDQTYVPKFSTTKDGKSSFKRSTDKRQPLEPDGKKTVHQKHDGQSSDKNASEEDANNDDAGFDLRTFLATPSATSKSTYNVYTLHRNTAKPCPSNRPFQVHLVGCVDQYQPIEIRRQYVGG